MNGGCQVHKELNTAQDAAGASSKRKAGTASVVNYLQLGTQAHNRRLCYNQRLPHGAIV